MLIESAISPPLEVFDSSQVHLQCQVCSVHVR